ncbi:hypothetical protein AB0F17_61960 [Nonomuraea sp. NPDC026600]|uniref:hypothetical protein n=1 Tax=Nonomuraea sp. NPDC026600 TaxID=3155363 RepID=UPI0033C7EE0E
MATLGDRLDQALRRKGYSSRKASKLLEERGGVKMSHAYIRSIARGDQTNVGRDRLTALADLLDVTYGWLNGDEAAPPSVADDDEQITQRIREGVEELDIQHIAQRMVGLSGISKQDLLSMVEMMRAAENLDSQRKTQ